ncbi:type III secretion system chaperone [Haliangium ochraceum]|uniref:Uncharacterized protein n=1 Tax=Haliangium ochraceum (strain DSM 14365 / JCM 11303 / SMP-2) TaxID=502025 RepID=D0LRV4_HALO1|nr:type III secretion system chaperone [Haliangium ochraceum]ACY19096.1 hypothetical protein Hoch_6630 [Haliangium ochraceum DSM 14365]
MSLRDDVDAGLAAIDAPGASKRLALNERGTCEVTVPIPKQAATLTDERLMVYVRMSRTGRRFSLRTPLAKMRETPDSELLENLLQRVYYPDQLSGLSVAMSPEDDALVAYYHWILDSITPEQFKALFTKFATGSLIVVREVAGMARQQPAIEPVHPKAG